MQYFPLSLFISKLHEQFCFIPQNYIQKSQDMRVPFVAEKQKKTKKGDFYMYKENQNKLINIVDDGDIIHIFIILRK